MGAATARLRRRGCARARRGCGGRDARRRSPAAEADVCKRSFSDLCFLSTVACSSFFSVLDEQQEQSRADSGRKKNEMREKGTRSKKSNLIFLNENIFSTGWCF